MCDVSSLICFLCRSSGVAAGPGFPGYPAPPPSQLPVGATTAHATGSGSSTNPVPLSTATEEQGGGASSTSGAPPASTPASPSATNSLGATSSDSSKRTGLFQSQNSYSGGSQPLLDEPQGSFAFSARSLSVAVSADGEAQEEEAQEQSEEEEVSTPQTSAHSANFTVGGEEEEDVSMMEVRQRRLQRFHLSPAVSPQQQSAAPLLGQDGSSGGGTGKTGGEAGESGTSESRD